jgi:hypothetical protein
MASKSGQGCSLAETAAAMVFSGSISAATLAAFEGGPARLLRASTQPDSHGGHKFFGLDIPEWLWQSEVGLLALLR